MITKSLQQLNTDEAGDEAAYVAVLEAAYWAAYGAVARAVDGMVARAVRETVYRTLTSVFSTLRRLA